MNIENTYARREVPPKPKFAFLEDAEKERYREAVFDLLREYPENFFPGIFEEMAEEEYVADRVVVAFDSGAPIGCLFFNPHANECNWLAVSKKVSRSKSEIAMGLFQHIFDSVPSGTKVFWYINTEDAVYEGRNVGAAFEPARRMYEKMGTVRTRVEDKFGQGNHAYRIEKTV